MIKKPLVLTNGEIEQLQAGDSLSPSPNSVSLRNGDLVAIPKCKPVFVRAADTMSSATGAAYPTVIGLLTESTPPGNSGIVQTDGGMVADPHEWDAVTGQTGGLTPGSTYYLGSSGGLTLTAPTTGNLTRIGISVNSGRLEINISRPIKL